MDTSTKVHENRLRRMADRQGLKLIKSRRRDHLALDYDSWWITDKRNNLVVGDRNTGMSLDDVEAVLTKGRNA